MELFAIFIILGVMVAITLAFDRRQPVVVHQYDPYGGAYYGGGAIFPILLLIGFLWVISDDGCTTSLSDPHTDGTEQLERTPSQVQQNRQYEVNPPPAITTSTPPQTRINEAPPSRRKYLSPELEEIRINEAPPSRDTVPALPEADTEWVILVKEVWEIDEAERIKSYFESWNMSIAQRLGSGKYLVIIRTGTKEYTLIRLNELMRYEYQFEHLDLIMEPDCIPIIS